MSVKDHGDDSHDDDNALNWPNLISSQGSGDKLRTIIDKFYNTSVGPGHTTNKSTPGRQLRIRDVNMTLTLP